MLDLVVQRWQDNAAALKLLAQLLRNQPVEAEATTTDRLASYGSALRELRQDNAHRPGALLDNNRIENHLPIRRRKRQQQLFKSQASAQRFLTTRGSGYNARNVQRRLIGRPPLRRFSADAYGLLPPPETDGAGPTLRGSNQPDSTPRRSSAARP